MKKTLLLALLCAGCAAPSYQGRTDEGLCIEYLTRPQGLYQPAREAEISRRGISCGQYLGQAQAALQAQRQADQAYSEALNSAARNLQRPAAPTTTTQTYTVNGKTVTCYTTGTYTNCY